MRRFLIAAVSSLCVISALAASCRSAQADVEVIVGGTAPTPVKHVQTHKHKAHVVARVSHTFDPARPAMIASNGLGGFTGSTEAPKPAPAPAKKPATTTSLAASSATRNSSSGAYTVADNPLRAQIVEHAMQYVGVPYVWGGASPEGFDCSGYAQYVLASVGIGIPRTADDQFYALPATADPRPGDLVFFQTYLPGPSHVGIYIGNGYFLNSIAADVHVSSFASEYFTSRYLGARRILPD